MTWHGPLSPRQFYHGTTADLKPGDHIEAGHGRTSHMSIKGHNYFTPSYYLAATSARNAGGRRVYKVEPTGEYGKDPGTYEGFRSKHPLRVTGEAKRAPDTAGMRALAKTYQTPHFEHGEHYVPPEKDPSHGRDMDRLERRDRW